MDGQQGLFYTGKSLSGDKHYLRSKPLAGMEIPLQMEIFVIKGGLYF